MSEETHVVGHIYGLSYYHYSNNNNNNNNIKISKESSLYYFLIVKMLSNFVPNGMSPVTTSPKV
jgi:hypothetical protein